MKRTALKRSTKIRKVNPTAKAKRVKKLKQHYASAEYKAARKEAIKRAGRQCEYVHVDMLYYRCEETEKLEAHHLRYPKNRALTSDDLEIRCRVHHHLTEMVDHPTRHPR
jgi:hypothetical protein